jgi:hypothetical protein
MAAGPGPIGTTRSAGAFLALMQDADALLLGQRTYVTHAEAFEPMFSLRSATPYPSGVVGLRYARQQGAA